MAGQVARQRRRALMKQKARIYNQVEPRKLRKSVRKQLKRERERRLWISPWVQNPNYLLGKTYPQASLLGLPTELRQKILYESFDTETLTQKAVAQYDRDAHEKDIRRPKEVRAREMRGERYTGVAFRIDNTLIRHVGRLSCVSALVRQDMEYVKRLWQRDVDHFYPLYCKLADDYSKHITVNGVGVLLGSQNNERLNVTRRKGKVVQGKERGLATKRRGKCFRCSERHFDADPVCPMARYDPKGWEKLTKKVGGWRASVCDTSLFRGTKIVFGDD